MSDAKIEGGGNVPLFITQDGQQVRVTTDDQPEFAMTLIERVGEVKATYFVEVRMPPGTTLAHLRDVLSLLREYGTATADVPGDYADISARVEIVSESVADVEIDFRCFADAVEDAAVETFDRDVVRSTRKIMKGGDSA